MEDNSVSPSEGAKSGQDSIVQGKSTSSNASNGPKRKNIITEDDDDDFLPTTSSGAPVSSAPASSALPKSSSSTSSTSSKKTDKDKSASTDTSSSKMDVDHADEEVVPKSKPSVKKSASKKESNQPEKSEKIASSEPADGNESDSDYMQAPPSKKKKASENEAVKVKTESKPVVKKSATPSTPTKTNAKVKLESSKSTKATSKVKSESKDEKPAKSKKAAKDGEEEQEDKKPAKSKTQQALEEKYKWWEEEASKAMKKHPKWKWATLHHNGVIFPPAYVPHGVKMLYDGKPVDLTPEQEEVASFYAKYLETEHVKKEVFRNNFFKDFLKLLNRKGQKHVIQKLELCDFTPIANHLKAQSELRKARSKEEKDAEKAEKAKLKAQYGTALVNGHKEPLGNYMIEPPGLFLGRGAHPKAGMIKKRVRPEDVTLNLSKDAPIPACPIPGHKWGGIIHNNEVAWIATWTENVLESNKYVKFGAGSSISGSSDRKKYEKARMLKDHIEVIRADYTKGLKSSDSLERQRSTAMWVIDRLALRVGNEKKEDEADTVGCCSLRVEHVKLIPPSTLEFDFLGKDSMRYHKEVPVPPEIYANFQQFMSGKRQSEDIFDKLSVSSLNNHLSKLMPGLSAKVFRTYNASITLQEQLQKFADEFGGEPGEVDVNENAIRLFYNRANREVAILCNHQRSISKTHQTQLDNIDAQIEELEEQKKILTKHLKALKNGTAVNPKKRAREEEPAPAKKGKKAKANEEEEQAEKKEMKLPATPESCAKKIEQIKEKIAKLETNKIDKAEGAQIQNSTSKINYMDPRITIAFCAKAGLPLNKVFAATLIDKFAWAIAEVEEDPDFLW